MIQGVPTLEEEEGMLHQQLENSFPVSLGGPGKPWGTALAVRTNDQRVIQKRSELGNRLALASKEAGHAPVGVIAYDQACCCISSPVCSFKS